MGDNVSIAPTHREQQTLLIHGKFKIELLLIFSPLIYHRPNSILSNRIVECRIKIENKKTDEKVLVNPVAAIDKRTE